MLTRISTLLLLFLCSISTHANNPIKLASYDIVSDKIGGVDLAVYLLKIYENNSKVEISLTLYSASKQKPIYTDEMEFDGFNISILSEFDDMYPDYPEFYIPQLKYFNKKRYSDYKKVMAKKIISPDAISDGFLKKIGDDEYTRVSGEKGGIVKFMTGLASSPHLKGDISFLNIPSRNTYLYVSIDKKVAEDDRFYVSESPVMSSCLACDSGDFNGFVKGFKLSNIKEKGLSFYFDLGWNEF